MKQERDKDRERDDCNYISECVLSNGFALSEKNEYFMDLEYRARMTRRMFKR